jgi:hypothetical protein
MREKWERLLARYMESVAVPGREDPLYKPISNGGFVWVLTGDGEFPAPPHPMDRQEMVPRGGREMDLDASDPDFLIVHKLVGMTEYTHCIPWDRISDILFMVRAL